MAIETQFPYQLPEDIEDFKQELLLSSKSEKSRFSWMYPLLVSKWMKKNMEITMLDKFNLVSERE